MKNLIQAMIDNIPYPAVFLDCNNHVHTLNPGAIQLMYSFSEIGRTCFYEWIHDELSQFHQCNMDEQTFKKEIRTVKASAIFQITLTKISGNEIYPDGTLVIFKNHTPQAQDFKQIQPSHVQNKMIKINQREYGSRLKQPGKNLEKSTEQYYRLAELSQDAIIVHSNGEILFANTKAAEMFKFDNPLELVGRHVLDFVPSEYHETAIGWVSCLEKNPNPLSYFECMAIRNDKRIIDVEVSGIPMIYNDRSAIQIIVRDITHSKREMRKASMLQRQRLTTKFPIPNVVELETLYTPFDMVSGDFFYLNKVSDHIVSGIIGDVSGNGITAALNTLALKVLFYIHASSLDNPQDIIKVLNREVGKYLEEDYVAACCFTFNFYTGQLKVCGAGINQFLCIYKDSLISEMTVLGPSLGMVQIDLFEEKALHFQPGDRFYFFTDGLESITKDKNTFDSFLKLQTIKQQKEFLEDILKAGSISDDCTWVAIEIK